MLPPETQDPKHVTVPENLGLGLRDLKLQVKGARNEYSTFALKL